MLQLYTLIFCCVQGNYGSDSALVDFLLLRTNKILACAPSRTRHVKSEHFCMYHCTNIDNCVSFNVRFITRNEFTCDFFTPSQLCNNYATKNNSKYFVKAFSDCFDLYEHGGIKMNGVYAVYPNRSRAFQVYCDMDAGGWTVFQSRKESNNIGFQRSWMKYKEGFGDLTTDFWLGNDKLYFLTNLHRNELQVTFRYKKLKDSRETIHFDLFKVGPENENYQWEIGETVSSIRHHSIFRNADRHGQFLTFDRSGECSKKNLYGGWWFRHDCNQMNPNGNFAKNLVGVEGERGYHVDEISLKIRRVIDYGAEIV